MDSDWKPTKRFQARVRHLLNNTPDTGEDVLLQLVGENAQQRCMQEMAADPEQVESENVLPRWRLRYEELFVDELETMVAGIQRTARGIKVQ